MGNGGSSEHYRGEISAYLLRKHGGNKNTRIIDIGAGNGLYADMLRKKFDGIDAVEAFPENVVNNQLDLKYRHVFMTDVMNMPISAFDGYDVAILGDMLEHLTVEESQTLLRELCGHVETVLVKVPWKYEQGAIYGNPYEVHKQADLTPEIFAERYPMMDAIYVNEHCGVYVSGRTNKTVCAELSTRGRYFSTLPMTLMAIATQRVVPEQLIIYDDNPKPEDLRKDFRYQHIFNILTSKGINWCVKFTYGRGQVPNHQSALTDTRMKYVWRLDDDNVPDPNVLEKLVEKISSDESIGAVSCKIHHYAHPIEKNPTSKCKIFGPEFGSMEWTDFDETYEDAEHLYSTFVFDRKAAIAAGGYETRLSFVGHCEETIFSNRIKLSGKKLVIIPGCVSYHLRNPEGGIRDGSTRQMFDSDFAIFEEHRRKHYPDYQ